MSDPFFDYIHNNKNTISRSLYSFDEYEKKYNRVVYHTLPEVLLPDVSIQFVLQNRKSADLFEDIPLKVEELSAFLQLSIARNISKNNGIKGYSFPSGGGFYPIETYVVIKNVEDFEPGVYHYSSYEHALARIHSLECEVHNEFLPQLAVSPGVFFLMTMVKSRTIPKYGSLSYKLSLLEAGHRGQNMYLAAATLGLGCRAFGYNDYNKVNALLGVDGTNEHYVYGIALGKI